MANVAVLKQTPGATQTLYDSYIVDERRKWIASRWGGAIADDNLVDKAIEVGIDSRDVHIAVAVDIHS